MEDIRQGHFLLGHTAVLERLWDEGPSDAAGVEGKGGSGLLCTTTGSYCGLCHNGIESSPLSIEPAEQHAVFVADWRREW